MLNRKKSNNMRFEIKIISFYYANLEDLKKYNRAQVVEKCKQWRSILF